MSHHTILVHICCGPCAITVLQRLQDAGHELCGLFFNPNIHPLAEYLRRREGAARVAEKLGVPMIFADSLPDDEQRWSVPPEAFPEPACLPDNYISPFPPLPPAVDPRPWLRTVAGREQTRCAFCWRIRLQKCAELAKARGFTGFTSSLLYSRYQKHEVIRGIGEELAGRTGLAFVYEDFRTGWQQGIAVSKEWGIYRQQYCGCVYSEYERYARELGRLCNPGEKPR